MKERSLLWADADHLDEIWGSGLDHLEEECGFQVCRLESVEVEEVLENCEGKGLDVIHCGTLRPIAHLEKLLKEIRKKYPETKIGLVTNTTLSLIEGLVDFHISTPIILENLEESLETAVAE